MVDGTTFEQSHSAPEDAGIPRASEGIKDLIGDISSRLGDEGIRNIDSRVEKVMSSDLPTAHAIEEALGTTDHGRKILFLAKFSDSLIRKALTGIEHEEESADRAAGAFFDALGIAVKKEIDKRSMPQDA